MNEVVEDFELDVYLGFWVLENKCFNCWKSIFSFISLGRRREQEAVGNCEQNRYENASGTWEKAED